MVKKTWSQLKKEDFTNCKPRPETHDAMDTLRVLYKQIEPGMTSKAFFKKLSVAKYEGDVSVGEIILDEVLHALEWYAAPPLLVGAIPILTDPDDDGAQYPYSDVALDYWLTLSKSKKNVPMLIVVSRCFYARAKMMHDRVLLEEGDWWIKLAVNDVVAGMFMLYSAANLPAGSFKF